MKIELKTGNSYNFYALETGTIFIWHVEDSLGNLGNMVGMKVVDSDGLNEKILELSENDSENGIYYDWNDDYYIDRIINCDLNLIEK